MTEAEQILELFDSYWFKTSVLRDKWPSSSSSASIQNRFPQPRQQVANNRSFTDKTMASTATNSSFQEGGNRKTEREQPGHHNYKVRPSMELEIKELRGFMDLGFVFSDEDKGCSRLVSLIPGLQKMGTRSKEEEEDESVVCSPYLSEAWGVTEQRKIIRRREINPLILFSRTNNEIDMKHNLRFWAHSVASNIISPSSC